MDRGQILGGVLGLVALLAAFLLPFSSIAEGSSNSIDSLLIIFKIFVIGVTNLQTVGLTQLAELAYIYMAAFVLLVVAGALGTFPRWYAFLGIVAMAILTFSPFVVFTSYSIGSTGFGIGFYLIWAATILGVYAAYWSRKERKKMATSMGPQTVQPTAGPVPTGPTSSTT